MRLLRISLATLVLLAASCMSVPIQPGPSFYVMRHLHTSAGESDPGLSAEGLSQARRLADWFASDPPATIYVSTTRRAQQSAAPLAAKLGIVLKLYDPADTPGLVAEVMKEPGTILIVGHSNSVPDIVEQLGGARPAPLTHEDFGDIWHVEGPGRTVTRSRL